MFAVCVTFKIIPDGLGTFLPLMRTQARNSMQLEPDCHHFDVCVAGERNVVFLYELYTDRAAFDAHLQSAHFKTFDADVASLVLEKSIDLFDAVLSAN